MTHIRVASFFYWVIVIVDDFIQILGCLVGNFIQLFVIEFSVNHIPGQGQGSEVTNGNLIG
jgi:hypothetical protein